MTYSKQEFASFGHVDKVKQGTIEPRQGEVMSVENSSALERHNGVAVDPKRDAGSCLDQQLLVYSISLLKKANISMPIHVFITCRTDCSMWVFIWRHPRNYSLFVPELKVLVHYFKALQHSLGLT